MQDAIHTLDRQSTAWQSTLVNLKKELVQDGQTTLANEVQNLLSRGVAVTSSEVRCDADFAGNRIKEELQALVAALEKRPIPQRQPHFCSISPSHIDLGNRRATNQVVDFFGYNVDLSEPQPVKVFLVDSSGVEQDVTRQTVSTPSAYHLTVNVSSTNGVPFTSTSSKLVLRRNGRHLSSLHVVQPPPPVVIQPVQLHRLYNGGNGDHFYTTDTNERDNAIVQFRYVSEGVACRVYRSQEPGTVPLYRLWFRHNGDHFYTTNEQERLNAMSNGYTSEGVAGFVFPNQAANTIPLYRTYRPANGDHFYTVNAGERDRAVSLHGYVNEGIAAYVFAP